jgi:hypothetical protein
VGHVTTPEPTSAGRCDSKLQLVWQRVDARFAPCLDLDLICGGTRSSGCRHGNILYYPMTPTWRDACPRRLDAQYQ